MHRLTFYPLGNADCCLIDLANGQKILFDYAGRKLHDVNLAQKRQLHRGSVVPEED